VKGYTKITRLDSQLSSIVDAEDRIGPAMMVSDLDGDGRREMMIGA